MWRDGAGNQVFESIAVRNSLVRVEASDLLARGLCKTVRAPLRANRQLAEGPGHLPIRRIDFRIRFPIQRHASEVANDADDLKFRRRILIAIHTQYDAFSQRVFIREESPREDFVDDRGAG